MKAALWAALASPRKEALRRYEGEVNIVVLGSLFYPLWDCGGPDVLAILDGQ